MVSARANSRGARVRPSGEDRTVRTHDRRGGVSARRREVDFLANDQELFVNEINTIRGRWRSTCSFRRCPLVSCYAI